MAGRKIRDEVDARACLSAAAGSGLGRSEWARTHDVDCRSLNAWWLNLGRPTSSTELEPVRLVELVTGRPTGPARYVIRCGDFAVEVDDRFDDATLHRLLGVVAAC